MGNPHCVLFVNDPDTTNVERIGPQIEKHPLFPKRTNVEFVKVIDMSHLYMRVWERGSKETLACRTGACAAVAAAVLNELCNRSVDITLRGGSLCIRWDNTDNHIYMEGPAEFVFDGEWYGDEMITSVQDNT